MLEKKDVKVGNLVWWSAERHMNSWSCPAVITKAGKKSFGAMSLDDFKEIGDLRMDDAGDKTSRREMRLCSLDEVKEFFKKKERVSEDFVVKKKREFTDAEEDLKNYKLQVEGFLAERK